MKRFTTILIALMCVALSAPMAMAQSFFDTSAAPKLLEFGARIGVNSSNVTIKDAAFDLWNKNSWGTGFDVGVVADINIRDFIAIQPGVFFQSRSGDYTYASRYWVPTVDADGQITNEGEDVVQYGHQRSYNLYVPVMASVRFNIGSKVRWMVDAGPYFNFKLGSSGNPSLYTLMYEGEFDVKLRQTEVERRVFDFGIKLGTGFRFVGHYYVGVHYMAGTRSPWKTEGLGGRNKGWTFTAGYDF